MKPVEVAFRSYHGSKVTPCIDVKTHHIQFPSAEGVAERFKCDKKTAQRALDFAVEMEIEQFWGSIQDTVRYYLKNDTLKAYSEGRSGGWLSVEGLPESDEWTSELVAQWAELEEAVRREMKYRASVECLFSDIEANRWAEPGAERYNFLETAEGTIIVSELNQHLAKEEQRFIQEHPNN